MSPDPVLLPLQSTFTWFADAPTNTAGSVMVTITDVIHPLASVMLYVYTPAAKLLNDPVPV